MAEEKSNHFGLLLISIVGIVAIAGLIIMFSGNSATSTDSGNIGGEAIAVGKTDICKNVIVRYTGEAIKGRTFPSDNIKDCVRLTGSDSPFVAGSLSVKVGNHYNSISKTYDNWIALEIKDIEYNNNDKTLELSKSVCTPDGKLNGIYYTCTQGILNGACKRTPIYEKQCKSLEKNV